MNKKTSRDQATRQTYEEVIAARKPAPFKYPTPTQEELRNHFESEDKLREDRANAQAAFLNRNEVEFRAGVEMNAARMEEEKAEQDKRAREYLSAQPDYFQRQYPNHDRDDEMNQRWYEERLRADYATGREKIWW